MKKRLQSILAAITLVGLPGLTRTHAFETAEPEVVGLMFYSDTCGSCKILDPKIEAVKTDYTVRPILFVTLDHSNEGSRNQAALLAEALGLAEIYAAQEKASGFMLLIHSQSGEVITKLTRDMSEADIQAAFDHALQS